MNQEAQPRHEQTISVVKGTAFITTRLYRTDINGDEFVTFENTQPYQGSLDDLKAETENLKAEAQSKLQATIADADNKLAQIESETKQTAKQ